MRRKRNTIRNPYKDIRQYTDSAIVPYSSVLQLTNPDPTHTRLTYLYTLEQNEGNHPIC